MKDKPAGWYRNLRDRRQHGYWDGEEWVDPHDLAPTADTPEIGSEGESDADEGADSP